MILDHPLLTRIYQQGAGLASEFGQFRVALPLRPEDNPVYHDPLGGAPGGEMYRRPWIAASEPVNLQSLAQERAEAPVDTGLVVLVQEDKAQATLPVEQLGVKLADKGLRAMAGFLFVVGLLWYVVFRVQGGRWWKPNRQTIGSSLATPTPPQAHSTTHHHDGT